MQKNENNKHFLQFSAVFVTWCITQMFRRFPIPMKVFLSHIWPWKLTTSNTHDQLTYRMMQKFDDICIRLDTIPRCDRRTDRNGKTISCCACCMLTRDKIPLKIRADGWDVLLHTPLTDRQTDRQRQNNFLGECNKELRSIFRGSELSTA